MRRQEVDELQCVPTYAVGDGEEGTSTCPPTLTSLPAALLSSSA
jgi:hypothetical protein